MSEKQILCDLSPCIRPGGADQQNIVLSCFFFVFLSGEVLSKSYSRNMNLMLAFNILSRIYVQVSYFSRIECFL